MASILKRGNYWRAFMRRRGYPTQTRTFDTKASAMGSADAAHAHDFLSHYTGSDPVQITYHIPREPGWKVWKSHVVTFDHVDSSSGNVYFRDPAGPQVKKGDYGDGHVDDANPGLYYMTRQEFLDSAISVVASSS